MTADGRVLRHLDGLVKDNTGYDLAGLLCGSEGTLAVVTAARLAPRPAPRGTGGRSLRLRATSPPPWSPQSDVRRRVEQLDAAELFLADGLDLVCATTGTAPPVRGTPIPSTCSSRRRDRPTPPTCLAGPWPAGSTCSTSRSRHRRAPAGPSCGPTGRSTPRRSTRSVPPHKLDVTLPARRRSPTSSAAVPGVVAGVAPDARCWLFGHVGDGNLHVNVTGVDADDESVDDAVLRLVVASGGSISAEHGIGAAKRRWLPLQRVGRGARRLPLRSSAPSTRTAS